MLERGLHGANVAACCSSLAFAAADGTLTGGLATGIGAALSGVAIFNRSDPKTQSMTKAMATAFDTHLSNTHLSDDDFKILHQMFNTHPPTLKDIAKGNENPDQVAKVICERIKDLGDKTDMAFQNDARLGQFARLVSATLGPLLEPQTRSEAAQAVLLNRSAQHGHALDQNTEQLTELMEMVKAQGSDTRLHTAGITPEAITQLAARISAKTDDLGQAWRDLENAMEIAVKVQAEGHMRSNHGDFVDTVLARVAELSATGDYASANAAIDAALKDAEAAKARLLESGVNIAKLAGDIERAATLLIAQADHAAGGAAEFEALRAVRREYYEKGRDKGVTQDSELAIALAQHVHTRATTSMARGIALNDLGIALQTRGQRESGTDRLDAAVTAYKNALLEYTRDTVPMQWAATQMNLGNALRTLGERESGTDRLDAAVTAYQNALLESTRDKAPMQWAMTQMNLGNALQTLGQRESGTDRLDAAVTAYKNALLERTRKKVPLDWAMTQMNLGNALRTLGERESGTDRLDAAVTAYQNALLEWTQDKVPMDWATTQMNLGNALAILGQRESSTDRLDAAVTAYQYALLERTRDTAPLQWAMVQFNLASVSIAFFDKTKDASHLEQAKSYVNAARAVFVQAGADHYIGMADQHLAIIAARKTAP